MFSLVATRYLSEANNHPPNTAVIVVVAMCLLFLGSFILNSKVLVGADIVSLFSVELLLDAFATGAGFQYWGLYDLYKKKSISNAREGCYLESLK